MQLRNCYPNLCQITYFNIEFLGAIPDPTEIPSATRASVEKKRNYPLVVVIHHRNRHQNNNLPSSLSHIWKVLN